MAVNTIQLSVLRREIFSLVPRPPIRVLTLMRGPGTSTLMCGPGTSTLMRGLGTSTLMRGLGTRLGNIVKSLVRVLKTQMCMLSYTFIPVS